MRIFHCDHCKHLVFFESTVCVQCEHQLAYLPDLQCIGSLEIIEGETSHLWCSPLAPDQRYRLCANYANENVCNWAVSEQDSSPLCISCRLTPTLPDMTMPGRKELWYRIETAKRRLVYSLMQLPLMLIGKSEDFQRGLSFEYVTDSGNPGSPSALTGHEGGLIRINLAEADDTTREQRKQQLKEPYRTLLGHFRHESGHYYWDQLIRHNPANLHAFRNHFGDERQDYAAALEVNYNQGPKVNWQQNYISAYASCHPWEDWAETWAHYLHMIDAVETASACGVSLLPSRPNEPFFAQVSDGSPRNIGFEKLIDIWFALSYMVNNFNRGLGLPDAYPFVLGTPVIAKLKFVHHLIYPASH